MTERKPLPGRQVVQSLEVVCTDRGQHTRAFLARVRWLADGSATMPWAEMPRKGNRVRDEDDDRTMPRWDPPQPNAEPGTGSRNSYTFWCRRCGRDMQVRGERWWELMEKARAARLSTVDISLLPR